MSELARANGWRGFDGLGERVEGGYEYRCDGVPSLMGCGENETVTRAWTRVGVKKSRWLVCYGLNDDGTADVDVVLTFCPSCAAIVATQSTEPEPEHGPDWSDWDFDHPAEGPSCRCGHNGSPDECKASRSSE